MQSNEQLQDQFEGLLLVEANQDEEGTVDIYTMQSGEMVLLESGGETFARTWLCNHARRLVSWKPRRLHDELSGIWRRVVPETNKPASTRSRAGGLVLRH